eukprot:6886865-Prorocentrum_lima.AAC.1
MSGKRVPQAPMQHRSSRPIMLRGERHVYMPGQMPPTVFLLEMVFPSLPSTRSIADASYATSWT